MLRIFVFANQFTKRSFRIVRRKSSLKKVTSNKAQRLVAYILVTRKGCCALISIGMPLRIPPMFDVKLNAFNGEERCALLLSGQGRGCKFRLIRRWTRYYRLLTFKIFGSEKIELGIYIYSMVASFDFLFGHKTFLSQKHNASHTLSISSKINQLKIKINIF